MKCPDKSCGFRTKDLIKFCPECGTKLISDGELVVICSGKTEEGLPCNTEINSSQKFCMNCGQKVDPQLFMITVDKCKGCGEVFKGAEAFCGECGLKRKPKPTLNETKQQDRETDTSNISPSEMEGVEETAEGKVKAEPDVPNDTPPLTTEISATHHLKSERTDNTNLTKGIQETAYIDLTGDSDRENQTQISETDESFTIVIDDNNKSIHDKEVVAQAESQELLRSGNITFIDDTPEGVSTGNIQLIDESSGSPVRDEASLLKNVDALRINESSNSSFNSENENMDTFDDKSSSKSSKRKCKSKEDLSKRLRTGSYTSETENDLTNSSESESFSNNCANGQISDGDSGNKVKHTVKSENRASNQSNSVKIKAESGSEDNNMSKKNKNMDEINTVTSDSDNSKIKVEQDIEEEHNQSIIKPVFGEAQGWSASKKAQPVDSLPATSLFTFLSSKEIKLKSGTTEGNENNEDDDKEARSPADKDDDTNQKSESDEEREMKTETHEDSEEEKGSSKEKGDSKPRQSERKKQTRREKNEKKIEKQKKKNPRRACTTQTVDSIDNTKSQHKTTETTSSQDKSAESQKPRRKNGKYYTIIFHVLVSPEFKFNPEDQKVLIKMDDETIGGKWKKDLELQFCRRWADDVCEMTYEVEVHEDKIRYGKQISYKYCLKKKDKDGYKYIWEDYVKAGKSGVDANRSLFVPYMWKEQDVWHQYDGFIEKSHKGMLEYMKSFLPWRKKTVSRFDFALETFIQGLVKSDMSTNQLSDSIVQLEMLQRGLWVTYCVDGKQWNSESEFKKDIGPKIVSCVLDCIDTNNISDEEESMKNTEQRIHSVLNVILALKRMGLVCDDPEKRQLICKLMAMKLPKDKSSCKEIELMDKLFPNKREAVLEAVTSMVQQITRTTKDPCWMYLMPWIHLLSGSVGSFEKPGFDMKHDRASAKWWGISQIGKECVEYFKGKTGDWQIPLEQHIEDLSPLFEIDYLLPRTIMASVELGKLKRVIMTEKIPFEVCLATTLFYIRKNKPSVSWGWSFGVYYSSVIDPLYETKDEKIRTSGPSVRRKEIEPTVIPPQKSKSVDNRYFIINVSESVIMK